MDLKTVDEPVRVSREESVPIVELRTSRTEGIGGLSHMLWQIPLISLNPCNQIKQKTKNQTTTVSEIKWNFKNPILNLNYVTNNMPLKQKDRWEI